MLLDSNEFLGNESNYTLDDDGNDGDELKQKKTVSCFKFAVTDMALTKTTWRQARRSSAR